MIPCLKNLNVEGEKTRGIYSSVESVWPVCIGPRLNPQYQGKRKKYETQNVNHLEVEKPCLDVCCFHHQNRKLGYFHLARKNVCKLSVHSLCPLMDWCLDVFLSKDVRSFGIYIKS